MCIRDSPNPNWIRRNGIWRNGKTPNVGLHVCIDCKGVTGEREMTASACTRSASGLPSFRGYHLHYHLFISGNKAHKNTQIHIPKNYYKERKKRKTTKLEERHYSVLIISTDINECVERPTACAANQECRNTVGSYTCHNRITCSAGYQLNDEGSRCEGERRRSFRGLSSHPIGGVLPPLKNSTPPNQTL